MHVTAIIAAGGRGLRLTGPAESGQELRLGERTVDIVKCWVAHHV